MKNCSFGTAGLIVIATAVVALEACKQSKQPAQVQKISARETFGMLRNGFAILVDVREADEVKDGVATDARWFPFSKIQSNSQEWQQFQSQIQKGKQVIFYCAAGGRAQKAAESLAAQGYLTANMGGYDDWVKEGFPVKKPGP